MNTEGVLPGPLNVPRRAVALRRLLVSSDSLSSDPMNVIDWINMFALAVSEENAAGGRVVTDRDRGDPTGAYPGFPARLLEGVSDRHSTVWW